VARDRIEITIETDVVLTVHRTSRARPWCPEGRSDVDVVVQTKILTGREGPKWGDGAEAGKRHSERLKHQLVL